MQKPSEKVKDAILPMGPKPAGARRLRDRRDAQRQELFALLEEIPAFVCLKSPDYLIRFANRAFKEIFGDPAGKRCFEVVYGRTTPCDECPSFLVLKTRAPQKFEWTGPDRARTYQVHNSLFIDVDGAPLVMTLGIDVTERRRIEDDLRQSEEKYRQLVNTIHAVVFKGYADWSIDFFDDKVEELTGYAKEDFDARKLNWGDLILKEDLAEAKKIFLTSLKGDRTYVREYRIRSKEGRIIWIQARGQIFCGKDGKVDHVSGVLFDITERQQAEENLRESEKNLRYFASQLLSAQEKERKRISRELHDELGQALLFLKLQLKVMQQRLSKGRGLAPEDWRELLSHVDVMVDDVRRLSRDLSPAILEDLGLSAALRRLVREFNKLYSLGQCRAEMDEIDDLFGSEAQINIFRIFQESLTNIAKYSQATRVTALVQRKGKHVSFLVADNGLGFNVSRVLGREGDSQGLGLAAIEERVRLLGGAVDIQSQEGAGTRISFTIPLGKEAG